MNRSIPVVIFLGAPGSGKGTQAAYLAHERAIPRVSTGDMLRQAVQEDSELGRKVQTIMEEGRLVDDETVLNLVRERISRPDCRNGFILDGYPRNLSQAFQLEQVLTPEMRLRALNIHVSDEEVVKRIGGRRTCPECERIYNVYFRPPNVDEKCDFDGATLSRRSDDDEVVIRKRLATYKKETMPLIKHYQEMSVLRVIQGMQSEDEVRKVVLEAVTF